MMKFYVVQFVETPYPNIEKYVCVPSSWIRRFKVRRVKVAYPTEDPKKTKRRVENEERFKSKWKLYKAHVKYDTDDYDEAEIWIDVMYAVENDENVPPVLNNNNTTSDAVKNPKLENSDVPNENKPLEMDSEDDQSALLKSKETQTQPSNPSEEIPVIKEEPTANKQDTPTEQPVLPCSEKQPKIEATESENDLNLSRDSMEILSEEPINQEVSSQRPVTPDMVVDACSVKDSTDIRASLENQTKESLFTAETFNFINNSIKSLQQKRISVVSDEFLFRGQEEPSKSTEINKNGETSLHGDHDKTLAIKIIEENLIKYVENRAQQNQDIKVNQNQIHPESLPDKPNGESSDVNHDGHIKTPCIANNVISTVQNVLGQASSHEIQHSTPQDTFLQQDSTKKDITRGPVEMISTIQETTHHNIRTKTASSEQNSSNPANNFCQPFEDSHENERLSPLIDFSVEYWLTKIRDSQETTTRSITSNLPIENVPSVPNQPYLSGESTEKQDFNVTIERDSNIHKIVITRSNEMECNNVPVPAQSFSNTSPSEHSLNTTNQASKVSKRQSQEFSAATKKRQPQDSPASKSIVRTTTGGVPMDLLGYGTSDTNNQIDQHHNRFPRIQQTLGEKTTNENSFIERTVMNAENRPYVVHNIPKKSYPTLRSSMDASKLVVSSNQQSTNQRMHLDRNINQNLIDPSSNSKDKTEEQSFGIQNSSRRSPIDELTIYVDDLDEEMPIQLTHAKGRNNTDQKTNPTDDMSGSTPNKISPNVVDQSKPAEVENLQNEFNELYRKMDTAVTETYKMFNQMRDTYVDYVETMKKAMKRVNDFCEMQINDISAPSKDIEENKGRHRNEELKRSYKHIGNNVDKNNIVNKNDDDENHKDLKKKCVHKRSSNIWNPYHGTRMI
ncbi:hypothetical protein ABMA27_010191 [Loxostege sticticalis]|uniref:Uncharacterized protein n=1 Tax=Loxostege sticticalis TaxID=481309 RepID=A0ABR3H4X4_LOXSC